MNLQGAAEVTPTANPLSHQLLKAMRVLTGATALVARAITRQTTSVAYSGITNSIEIGSTWNMRRYVLADMVLCYTLCKPLTSFILCQTLS
jgi:hypothetical protein